MVSSSLYLYHQPNYPPDYAAFIAKPMDWERCQKTLKKRQYDKFGDVITDLRLIFSNALKYNARHEGTETVSGRAFASAKHMSSKLEVAINKMMPVVFLSTKKNKRRVGARSAALARAVALCTVESSRLFPRLSPSFFR